MCKSLNVNSAMHIHHNIYFIYIWDGNWCKKKRNTHTHTHTKDEKSIACVAKPFLHAKGMSWGSRSRTCLLEIVAKSDAFFFFLLPQLTTFHGFWPLILTSYIDDCRTCVVPNMWAVSAEISKSMDDFQAWVMMPVIVVLHLFQCSCCWFRKYQS